MLQKEQHYSSKTRMAPLCMNRSCQKEEICSCFFFFPRACEIFVFSPRNCLRERRRRRQTDRNEVSQAFLPKIKKKKNFDDNNFEGGFLMMLFKDFLHYQKDVKVCEQS